MLQKRHRLTKEKDFTNVHRKGRVFRGSFLAIKAMKNEQEHTRVGFLVGKKISKSAVKRGRVKRRLRSVVGDFVAKMKPGLDIVVMVRPAVLEKTTEEMQKELETVFQKANIFSS